MTVQTCQPIEMETFSLCVVNPCQGSFLIRSEIHDIRANDLNYGTSFSEENEDEKQSVYRWFEEIFS
jgi:hypothetical protein